MDRGTVAKYADMEDCSPKPKADRRYGSKIDPYAHLVDEWLEADRLLPRKQRHTIRRVHDRLLAETDYDGEWEYPGGIEEPDLSGYDRFITGTDDGGEER